MTLDLTSLSSPISFYIGVFESLSVIPDNSSQPLPHLNQKKINKEEKNLFIKNDDIHLVSDLHDMMDG
jgi:hypothetical protein